MTYFEPTDVFRVPKGLSVRQAFVNSEYAILLSQADILEKILSSHGLMLEDLDADWTHELILLLNHPKMYMSEYSDYPCGQRYRNRSFDLFKFRVEYSGRKEILEKLFRNTNQIHCILELGAGTGRALLQLQNLFPQAQVYGIGLPKESIDLSLVAEFFDIQNCSVRRPKMIEVDLNDKKLSLAFRQKIDFIFSQATTRYILEKVLLIEDIWNSLREGGIAIIELQFMEIRDVDNHLISLEDFFGRKEWREIFSYDKNTHLLFIEKKFDKIIKLPLVLLKEYCRHQKPHPVAKMNEEVGWLSVYQC